MCVGAAALWICCVLDLTVLSSIHPWYMFPHGTCYPTLCRPSALGELFILECIQGL